MIRSAPLAARPVGRHRGRLATLATIDCPATGRRLQLRRAWPRAGDHLLLEYLDDQGGHGTDDATVAGQWFAGGAHLRTVADQTAAMAGPTGTVATLDHLGVVLQRGGADRRLGALAGVLAAPEATLVVHRPERRAVVRLLRGATTSYVKVLRPGRLPVALRGAGRLRTPVVLERHESEGRIECAELAGTSLHALLGDPATAEADVVEAARATGVALRQLHATAVPDSVLTHDAAAELGVVERWLHQAVAHEVLAGSDAPEARDHLARTADQLSRQPAPESTVLVHRDLHDKQVFLSAGGDVGVLDLDTLARGDPALDLANLLVHLELRVLQGRCHPGRAQLATAALIEGYQPDAALQARLGGYRAATRLRLACVYAFRPSWIALIPRLLAAH